MTRGKHILDLYEKEGESPRFQKIKTQKRSSKGRLVDDWVFHSKKDSIKIEKALSNGLRYGRVIEVQKKHIFVAEESKQGAPETDALWFCTVAKRHFQRVHKERNFVVVGDRVLFEPDPSLKYDKHGEPIDTDLPAGVIQHSLARTSQISRKDPLHPEWEHVMLANIDMIAIVASVLNPEVRWGLIDRFLVQAELEQLPALIILNKVDLFENPKIASEKFLQRYKEKVELYKSLGYQVLEICSLKPKKTWDAVKHLRTLFKGKLVGLAGHSGVGKSSVINLLRPEFEQIVDDNPDVFYKGRHTTTYNSLLQLGTGGYAIDTPGIRSFQIDKSNPILLSSCFLEFKNYRCKYKECAHDQEEECEIKKAVDRGEISMDRYRSYRSILRGISYREGCQKDKDAPSFEPNFEMDIPWDDITD